jgi:DNA-binding transcriptional LysR family regulator
MNINDWITFVHIVDIGGLSAASRKLGIPKSTLSRRLSRLEDDFGSRLLNRRGRTFELTEAGRLFYQEAHNLAGQIADARERLSKNTQQKGGIVRMAAPKAPGGRFLGVWLAEFLLLHPHIRIELDLSDQMSNLFEHGYDLALRVGPLIDSSLIARKLGISERILVASPDYLNRQGSPETPTDLSSHSCIGFSEQHSGRVSWLLSKSSQVRNKQNTQVDFYPVIRNDDMSTTLCMTQAGAGISMIPIFVCKDSLKSGQLQRVLPQWYGPTAEFYLVYMERKLIPSRLRLLIDFLTQKARSEKWHLSMKKDTGDI